MPEHASKKALVPHNPTAQKNSKKIFQNFTTNRINSLAVTKEANNLNMDELRKW